MKSEPEARVLRRAVTLVPALHRAASAVLKLAVVPAVVLVLVLVLVEELVVEQAMSEHV